ncbi:MAG TPA: 23S rRNA (guanosine(2251)-2'-O)-methyltransferase RlmB, partial [Actinomycetota bacterium]|nr:23S rRNA (guanosine(2251)-2'-O)-methyltransferase RlmB [Actinomycetota bacterium]
ALEAVRSGRASEVLLADGSRQTPGLRDLLDAARETGVPVRTVPRQELDRLAAEHQGVVARVETPHSLTECDLSTWPFDEDAIVVVLDGVTDPQNLGAAARSAEAAGAAMLVTRVRRSAPVSPAAVRASAGALLHLPHARVANVTRALTRLQEAGFFVVGLDGAAPSSVYDEPCPTGRIALVLGGEGGGLSRLAREHCDALVALPMAGRVASLNASAALAAVLYSYVVPSRRPTPA